MYKKKYVYLYLIFIIFFIGYFPFLKDVYVNCDGQFYLSRIESIFLNLKDGIYLPNIQAGNMNGYGYLIDVFYPSLFYYLPALLRFFLPVNICFYISLCVYKVLFISLTYFFGKKLFSKELILKFILIYYSNFIFLYDILIRECFSEYIAALILPLFLLGLYDLFKNNKYRTLVLSMVLILSAHLLTLYICVFIVFVCFLLDFRTNKLKHLKSLCLATLEPILLSSYFLVPFLYYFKDYRYEINLKIININTFYDLIYILLLVIFLVGLYFINKRFKINYFLNITFILLYICTPLFPMSVFSFLEILQFKSRLYMFVMIFFSLYLINSLNEKWLIYILKLVPLYSILFFTMIVFSKNALNLEKNISYTGYTGNYNLMSNFDEKYLSIINGEYLPNNLEINEYKGNINSYYDEVKTRLLKNEDLAIIEENNSKIKFISNSSEFIIPKLYYPLYKVYQKDNRDIFIENKDGYIYVKNVIPDKEFMIYYEETDIQYIGFLISIFFLCNISCRIYKKKETII